MRNALVVVAHLLDAMLCCGGTSARQELDGIRTRWLICRPEEYAPSIFSKVGAVLGLTEIVSLELMDVAAAAARFAPDIVFTHWQGDEQPDHRAVREAVAALYPLGRVGKPVSQIAMEIDPAIDGHRENENAPFIPNLYSDISATIEKKIAALSLLSGPPATGSHPWIEQAVRETAVAWGVQCGLAAVEPLRMEKAR